MTPRVALAALAGVAASTAIAACGSQGVDVKGQSAGVERGAQLFAQRCSGCHTLDIVGAEGGATKIKDRERVDGPNFNVRKEDVQTVLYAIRNGGFSGAIMPENIVVGQDAQDVADFLAKYSGGKAGKSPGAPAGSPPGGS
jgi:mono/diheme cytochrome c family protein